MCIVYFQYLSKIYIKLDRSNVGSENYWFIKSS